MRSKGGKLLWSKLSLKSLLKHGPKNKGFEADEDDDTESELDDEDLGVRRRYSSCSTQGYETSRWSFADRRHSSALSVQTDADLLKDNLTSKQHFRIFIGTWNVGGNPPHEKMNLEQWLNLIEPADIYVIGFQEIVPLNAGNVLGVDDKSSAMQWLQLIQKALNRKSLSDLACSYADTISPRANNRSFSANLVDTASESADSNERADLFLMGNDSSLDFNFPIVPEDAFLDESLGRSESITSFRSHTSCDKEACRTEADDSPLVLPSFIAKSSALRMVPMTTPRYALIASKRMVGIFLSVWVRHDLSRYVRHVKISSVGCGIMGYLRNKGSISISLCLHQTTFCFICSHLTSGEKEGDELRRNYDVSVILKRTRFRRSSQYKEGSLPDTILDHDRILWFGDLNYRLTLSSTSTKLLLARGDWETLLERDQLHIERRAGRVFKGWHEGKICFPPTYKYRTGSDCYAVERLKFGEKRRTPAWCDRILWYGEGLKQLEYVRAESNFSDHRPVYSVFSAEVEVPDPKKLGDFST